MRPLNNFINEKLQISRNTKRYIDYVAELKAQNKFSPSSIAYWEKYLGVDPTVIDYSVSKRAAAIIDIFGRNNQIEHLFDYLASEGPLELTEPELIKKVAYVDIPDFEYYNGELNAEPGEINKICKIHEKLQISRNKKIEYLFDNIQPISNPSGDMVDILYDSLDAWIYRDKEDERYDLLRVYESEDELPLFNAAYYVSGLNINKQEYTIMLECKHINIGGTVGVSKLPLSRIATILGKNDKEKGYGVINYIIKDIDM